MTFYCVSSQQTQLVEAMLVYRCVKLAMIQRIVSAGYNWFIIVNRPTCIKFSSRHRTV